MVDPRSAGLVRPVHRRPPAVVGMLVLLTVATHPFLVAAQTAPPTTPPRPPESLYFETRSLSFGEVYQGTPVEVRFDCHNRSSSPVTISEVDPQVPGGTALFEPAVVPPGASAEIVLRQTTDRLLGVSAATFILRTDDPGKRDRKLIMRGFVQSAYEPETGAVDLGLVDRAQGETVTFDLETREARHLGLVNAETSAEWLHVEAVERGDESVAGIRLQVTVTPTVPLGPFAASVDLTTDLPHQPRYHLRCTGTAVGDLVPSPLRLDLGLVRLGRPITTELRLTSRSGRSFEIASVEGLPPGAAFSHAPCPDVAGGEAGWMCQLLRLDLDPVEAGRLTGVIAVHPSTGEPPVPIPFHAFVVTADTEVKRVVVDDDPGTEAARKGPAFPTDEPPASPRPEPGTEPGEAPQGRTGPAATVSWRAVLEEHVYGYLVYRSESRAGPFLRISDDIIRVAPGDGGESSYHFTDTSVEPGRTYYYYVDVVTRTGEKKRFSPVGSKTVPDDASA